MFHFLRRVSPLSLLILSSSPAPSPPSEAFPGTNFFGGISREKDHNGLLELEKNGDEMFVVLSDVWLDKPEVRPRGVAALESPFGPPRCPSALRLPAAASPMLPVSSPSAPQVLHRLDVLLHGYATMADTPPAAFVFMGNFSSVPHGQGSVRVMTENFNRLEEIISRYNTKLADTYVCQARGATAARPGAQADRNPPRLSPFAVAQSVYLCAGALGPGSSAVTAAAAAARGDYGPALPPRTQRHYGHKPVPVRKEEGVCGSDALERTRQARRMQCC